MNILFISHDSEPVRRMIGELQRSGVVVNYYPADKDTDVVVRHDDSLAIVLGPDLGDIAPYDVIKRWREEEEYRPILIIATETLYARRVALLNIGADDVVFFPCSVEELVARIRAVIRRSRGFKKPEIRANGIIIDTNTRCAFIEGKKIFLTNKEYQILEFLVTNRGKVISKEIIFCHLYKNKKAPGIKVIDVLVCKLRKKIQNAGGAALIETVWGHGYIVRDEALPHGA